MWRISIYRILSLYGLEREIRMKTRIKEFRARYDLTQEDLARKVGVRRETILFIEKGKYNPSLKLAYDIAKALNTTIEELFIFEID
jgi:putative transcriptional regulator